MCRTTTRKAGIGRYEFEREREWLREWCGKIALRVSIDRRRRWASFHRNPFVKRGKKELVPLRSLPEFASLSPCRSVAGFKSSCSTWIGRRGKS